MADESAAAPGTSERRTSFGVSPPTPTASSAGPSLAVQGNMGSIDWHGLGPKKASASGISAGPPRPAVSTDRSSSHRLLCRPWDCGDLLRRLSTYKITTWNHKPQVIGPAVCARKGWVNIDVDRIGCEGCDTHLSFSLQRMPQHEVEAAAESFREQLEAGHQASCPWKGNACAESLAQFPSSSMALIGGYNDRCDALLQLQNLPIISPLAVDHMKLSRGPHIDRLLSQPPAEMDRNTSDAFCKAQRIISICGWEARLLPHAADFEDHSAQSTRNRTSHKRGKRNSMPRPEREEDTRNIRKNMRYNPASTLLECIYCGANVNILRFKTVARQIIGAPGAGTSAAKECSETKNPPLVRGVSTASSIDLGGRKRSSECGDAGEATTSSQKQQQNLTGAAARGSQSNLNNLPAEGSEMGDCGAASYESQGPRDDPVGTGQGDSSIYVPQLRAESGGDFEGDDEGKSCAAESSKRKRAPEMSLAADQYSLGVAISGNATSEDAEVGNDRKNKRICIGVPIVESTRGVSHRGLTNPSLTRKLTGEFPCSSSVNATDTCFQNKMENSIESVEYMPQDDPQQNTAASGYTENEWMFDEPNSGVQGQQSTSYIPPQGNEKSETNAAVISTGTATAAGGSVDMTGLRVQSNEGDIQGADVSEYQTESVAGEAVVIDAVDVGLVCDSTPPASATGARGDSRDAAISLQNNNSVKDNGDESGESGSKASLRPDEERTIDTTNAVIMGGRSLTKDATDGSVDVAVGDDERAVANSGAPTMKEVEDTQLATEFDPIRSHRSFCPWVNGLVLSAANGTFGTTANCGWQLTVDALDAFLQHENIPAGVTESESTASMCKDEPSTRMFAQASSSQQCNGSSRLDPN